MSISVLRTHIGQAVWKMDDSAVDVILWQDMEIHLAQPSQCIMGSLAIECKLNAHLLLQCIMGMNECMQ